MATPEQDSRDWKARLVERFAARLDRLEHALAPNTAFSTLELAVDDVGKEVQTALLEAMATRRDAAISPPGLPAVCGEDAAQRPGSVEAEESLG